MVAQAYYQMQNYKEAEKSLIQALIIARQHQQQPKENWLALLRAVYYEGKNYPNAAKVLEILVAQYPDKASYWQQLAGMYGLMDRQPDQLKIMHAAYQAGFLTTETELLNLVRLYMVRDTPYPAVRLIDRGFKAKTIEQSPENLQLYAQALALSKEYEQQIPVLKQLAEASGEAKYYVSVRPMRSWASGTTPPAPSRARSRRRTSTSAHPCNCNSAPRSTTPTSSARHRTPLSRQRSLPKTRRLPGTG